MIFSKLIRIYNIGALLCMYVYCLYCIFWKFVNSSYIIINREKKMISPIFLIILFFYFSCGLLMIIKKRDSELFFYSIHLVYYIIVYDTLEDLHTQVN